MKTCLIILLAFTVSLPLLSQDELDTALVRTYGGDRHEEAQDILQTVDGGYLILGSSASQDMSSSDLYLIKVTRDLDYEWSKLYGGSNIDRGQAIIAHPSGGFLLLGYTLNASQQAAYDISLYKINDSGDVEWSKTYGGTDWDFGYEIVEHEDGGFLMVGETWSYGEGMNDMYLVKIDGDGELEWDNSYGGLYKDYAVDIHKEEFSGGYLIAGSREVEIDSIVGHGCLLKINEAGQVEWELIDLHGESSVFNSVDNFDSQMVCSGFMLSENGLKNFITRIVDDNGDLDAFNIYTTPGNQSVKEIIYVPQEDIFLSVGDTDSYGFGGDGLYAHRASVFALANEEARVFGGTEDETGNSILLDDESSVIYAGASNSFGFGSTDVYLVKIDDPVLQHDYIEIAEHHYDEANLEVSTVKSSTRSLVAFPNPTSATINLDVEIKAGYQIAIFNEKGKLVEREYLTRNIIQLQSLSKGFYYIYLLDNRGRLVGASKVIKI